MSTRTKLWRRFSPRWKNGGLTIVVAGPAFNAGRYGLACVEICLALSERLGLRCVTGMEPENPAVSLYRDAHNEKVFLFPTAETAAGMIAALKLIAPFACRLALGEEIGPAGAEGYISRGIRRLTRVDRPAVDRAIDMLLAKVAGEPFETEVPMEVWDKVDAGGAAGRRSIGEARGHLHRRCCAVGQPGWVQNLPQHFLAQVQFRRT